MKDLLTAILLSIVLALILLIMIITAILAVEKQKTSNKQQKEKPIKVHLRTLV